MNQFDALGHTPIEDSEPFSATRLIVGLLLLVPGTLVYLLIQFFPALQTLAASQTNWNMLNPPKFVGMENYTQLSSDAAFGTAVVYTLLILFARLLIVALVPPLVGGLVGAQGFAGRATNRLLLSVLAVLIVPVALPILLRGFIAPIWGTTPSPLTAGVFGMNLSSPDGARGTVLLLDAVITAAIAAVVGGAAFMAVMRGREVSPSSSRAGIGVWLIGLLLALGSAPQTFTLPFILTAGGPGNSTMTLSLYFYKIAFQFLKAGYASALASLMIFAAIFIGLLVGIVIWGFRLRLNFTPPAPRAEAAGLLSFLSVPLVVLIGLPSLVLVVWGLWLATSGAGFSSLNEIVNQGQLFTNTVSGSWLAIWLIQIPLTYMVGLALGFVRPINRTVSNIVFLGLLMLAFIPPEALSLQWWQSLRDLGWINTTQATGYTWVVGVFSLVIFKLFFDGAFDRYKNAREDGQTSTDAFLNTVLLPSLAIVLLVGAVLSFVSAQALWWPLIVTNDQASLGFGPQIFQMTGQFSAKFSTSAALSLVFIGLFGVIFLPVFALLQVLVLDRLALLAGPQVIWGKSKRSPTVESNPAGF
jgi:multiple sugar transport system permease protein